MYKRKNRKEEQYSSDKTGGDGNPDYYFTDNKPVKETVEQCDVWLDTRIDAYIKMSIF